MELSQRNETVSKKVHLAFALSFGADLYYILVWFRNHHREHFRSVLNAQLSIEPLSERLFWCRKACISTKLTFSHQSAVNNSNFSLGHTHTLTECLLILHWHWTVSIKKQLNEKLMWIHGQQHMAREHFFVWFMASDTAEINQSPLCVQTKRRLRTVHMGMWEMHWIALTQWFNHYKRIKYIYFVSECVFWWAYVRDYQIPIYCVWLKHYAE